MVEVLYGRIIYYLHIEIGRCEENIPVHNMFFLLQLYFIVDWEINFITVF